MSDSEHRVWEYRGKFLAKVTAGDRACVAGGATGEEARRAAWHGCHGAMNADEWIGVHVRQSARDVGFEGEHTARPRDGCPKHPTFIRTRCIWCAP